MSPRPLSAFTRMRSHVSRLPLSLTLALSVAFALPLPHPLGAQESERKREVEEHEDPLARELAFWARRSYPRERIAGDAYVRARAQMAAMPRGGIASPRSAADGATGTAQQVATAWQSMGPSGLLSNNSNWSSMPYADEGRVRTIAIDPLNPNVIYAGAASGGVWKSLNGGANWVPLADNACSLSIGSLTIDPVNPLIVYAGTGEPLPLNTFRMGCGVLRSTDGGLSWTNVGRAVFAPAATSPSTFYEIALDRRTAGTTASSLLLAATTGGLFRSTDGGTNWTRPLAGQVTSVIQHVSRPELFYAAIGDGNAGASNGVYRSTDGGVTWTLIGGAFPARVGRLRLTMSPAAPGALFAAAAATFSDGSGFGGLFRYDEATDRWTRLEATGIASATGTSVFGGQTWYNLAIGVDPTDASRIFVGGTRLFRSTDGGATFSMISRTVHADWHTVVFDPRSPQTIVGGNDGGVHMSFDGGTTWVGRNTGLSLTQFYPGVSVHPTNPSIILGGLQDNGTVLTSGLETWDGVFGGDGGYTAINPQNPSIMYLTSQWGNGPTIIRRAPNATGGFTNSSRITGIATSDRAQFIPPLVISPQNPNTLYFGTQRLYRTTNEGVSWTAGNQFDLSRGSGSITSIAPSPADALLVWVGVSDGSVQVSIDGGVTFVNRSTGLPNRIIERVYAHPTNTQRALVTVSGFGTGHLWQTTDQGATWSDISGNLPDVPANAVVVIPGTPEQIVVGTDVGAFVTSNGGTTWSTVGTGLPNVFIEDLIWHSASGRLIAATYGRGVWSLQVGAAAAVLRGDVNGDGVVNAADALLIQQALAGAQLPTGVFAMPAGDANCDGRLGAADALIVVRFSVGLDVAGACVNTRR